MAPTTCSVCSQTTRYRVMQVAPNGDESPLTSVCSVKCLLQWGYAFASMRGMQMAYGVKQKIEQLRGLFKS